MRTATILILALFGLAARALTAQRSPVTVEVSVPKEPQDRFRRFLELGTFCVVVLGLVLGWDQANKIRDSIDASNKSTNLASWANIATLTLEMDKLFVDNPGLQKYFSGSVAIDETHADYELVMALAAAMMDYFDSVASFNTYLNQVPNPIVETGTWNRYFESTFRTSPILCKFLSENLESYGSSIRKVGEPACGLRR